MQNISDTLLVLLIIAACIDGTICKIDTLTKQCFILLTLPTSKSRPKNKAKD